MKRLNKHIGIGFLIACVSVAFSTCTDDPTPQDCSPVKEGTYVVFSEATKLRTILYRNDTSQWQTTGDTGDTTFFKVRWANDCTYELHYKSGIQRLPESRKEYAKTHPITIKILNVQKDFYVYRVSIPGLSGTGVDTAFRLNAAPTIPKPVRSRPK